MPTPLLAAPSGEAILTESFVPIYATESDVSVPSLPLLIGVALPAARSVNWQTDVPVSVGGLSTAIGYQGDAIYHWELPYSVLRANVDGFTEFQRLVSFINSLRARVGCFYYQDPDDYTVTDEPFGTGDGVATTFQLQRAWYGVADAIQNPNVISDISINGVPVAPSGYTIAAGGIVNFTSPPASAGALTWSGTYLWLCRFDQDQNNFPMFLPHHYESKKLAFTQVPV